MSTFLYKTLFKSSDFKRFIKSSKSYSTKKVESPRRILNLQLHLFFQIHELNVYYIFMQEIKYGVFALDFRSDIQLIK